ncbi:very short patch repair endonuclease [Massilimicrobiota timonensis]|uniref:very short patch repair endonuclease n=1 Tax=Massilimicrobiota timonensis TaxID=1776392 RepID=UPI0036F1B341
MKHKELKTTPEVSKRMKALSHKKSKVESVLAKALWHKGYHYRLNYKKLPGTPDIALTKYKIAIFVDGEFWHGKDFEKTKEKLKNNKDYWIEKIEENIQRDIKNDNLLRQIDWIPIHFWSDDVKSYLAYCINEIEEIIQEVCTTSNDL